MEVVERNEEKIIQKDIENSLKENKFDVDEFKIEFMEMLFYKKEEDMAINLFLNGIYRFYKFIAIADDTCTELMYYDKRLGIYKENGKSVIKSFYGKTISAYKGSSGDRILNKIISKITHSNYIDFKTYYNTIYEEDLVVGNGILNLKTLNIKPYTHTKIHRIRIPWKYNENADSHKITDFLKTIVNKDDLVILQEFIGFTLCKNYKYQKFLILEGRGSNGKSIFLKMLRYFYTQDNYTGYSISDFSDLKSDDFSYSGLFDKLVNLGGDTGVSILNDSSIMKRLTGDDVIEANRKFKSKIVFSNTSKFISSFNELPETFDITEGLWRRVLFIEFPFTYVPKNDYEKNTIYKKDTRYKKADENILDKILIEENMEALLKWAIDGYKRLISQGGFSITSTTEEVRKRWIHKSNSFEAFLDNECEIDDGWGTLQILKQDLRDQYTQYCEDNKLRTQSNKSIKKSLDNRKVTSKQIVRKNQTKGTYYWSGFCIKKNSPYYLGEEDEQ